MYNYLLQTAWIWFCFLVRTPYLQHISVCGLIFKYIRLHSKSLKSPSSFLRLIVHPSQFYDAHFTLKWLKWQNSENFKEIYGPDYSPISIWIINILLIVIHLGINGWTSSAHNGTCQGKQVDIPISKNQVLQIRYHVYEVSYTWYLMYTKPHKLSWIRKKSNEIYTKLNSTKSKQSYHTLLIHI